MLTEKQKEIIKGLGLKKKLTKEGEWTTVVTGRGDLRGAAPDYDAMPKINPGEGATYGNQEAQQMEDD